MCVSSEQVNKIMIYAASVKRKPQLKWEYRVLEYMKGLEYTRIGICEDFTFG